MKDIDYNNIKALATINDLKISLFIKTNGQLFNFLFNRNNELLECNGYDKFVIKDMIKFLR